MKQDVESGNNVEALRMRLPQRRDILRNVSAEEPSVGIPITELLHGTGCDVDTIQVTDPVLFPLVQVEAGAWANFEHAGVCKVDVESLRDPFEDSTSYPIQNLVPFGTSLYQPNPVEGPVAPQPPVPIVAGVEVCTFRRC